jgi:hypothetical protein
MKTKYTLVACSSRSCWPTLLSNSGWNCRIINRQINDNDHKVHCM